jgi:parallel beta-helix repeat protein
MWRRALKIFLLLFMLPVAGWAVPLLIEGEQQWRGRVEISGPVKVEHGAVLSIAPGSRIEISDPQAKLSVRGRLLVQGTAAAPVIFSAPAGWQGISFVEADSGSSIESARFADCRQGVSIIATSPQLRNNQFSGCEVGIELLRESQALIESNSFVDNHLGVKVGMRSSPTISHNSFSGQQEGVQISNGSSGSLEGNHFTANQSGISLHRAFAGEIRDNQFEKNQVGIYAYQTRNTPLIEANQFTENEQGILAFSFSYPVVRNNRFVANGVALKNDQFGSALVEHNLFRNNRTALFNNRKSNPQLQKNLFERNNLVLFCDYSSYPQVEQNNFLANKMAVELGIYQSADWEQKAGSKGLIAQQAQARGSRNPLLVEAPTKFEDRVDVSGNWWGERTALLQQVGTDANLDFFIDRRDKPKVSYPGYGEERYLFDLIVYAPWLQQPVSDAGPQEFK